MPPQFYQIVTLVLVIAVPMVTAAFAYTKANTKLDSKTSDHETRINQLGDEVKGVKNELHGMRDIVIEAAGHMSAFDEGMSLLAQWLGLQTTLEQLDAQLSNTTTPAINDFTAAVVNSASAMSSAIGGLASYLRGSLLGDLSPLSPQARYAEAKKQFNDNLTLAQGGNIDAISSFGSYRDQFLSASRAVNASSGQYNTDFFGSFNAGAALTGGAVRPYTAADANVNTSAIVAAIAATASGQQVTNTILVDYLNELAQGNTSQNSSKIVELLGMLNDRVRINGGALTSNSGALA